MKSNDKKTITQSEFIRKYCEKSNVSEECLNKSGIYAIPCACNYPGCEGWVMDCPPIKIINKEPINHKDL